MNSDNNKPLTTMRGTLPYMSLEMKEGKNYDLNSYDYRTDIW